MTVKELIEFLECAVDDHNKKVCVYDLSNGVRIPLTKIDIDINCDKVVDFNVNIEE